MKVKQLLLFYEDKKPWLFMYYTVIYLFKYIRNMYIYMHFMADDSMSP